MFTGLVQDTAKIVSYEADSKSECWNLWLETRLPTQSWSLGDSIACNGVCLTIVAKEQLKEQSKVLFQLGPETLKITHFSKLNLDSGIHLETSLRAGDKLGGHWVSGHVDGMGRLKERREGHEVLTLTFVVEGEARPKIAPYLVKKGSIAVDGVSLTVNDVRDTSLDTEFDVTLIPHTLKLTRFGALKLGDSVNLEADIMAKHAARYADYWEKNAS